jgi:ABC-2 type transport system ATP-binding protein
MNAFENPVRRSLQHGDDSLAIRKLLDLSYESRELPFLEHAISISRASRDNANDAWKSEALNLSDQIMASPIPESPTKVLIEATQIAKAYAGSSFKLNPVSLRLQHGEILGLVGENGNGKTTLLRCLSGQLQLDRGTLAYPSMEECDAYTVRGQVAFIPQRIPRWYGFLRDNLVFSAALSGHHGRENQLMVDFMLERLNLAPYANLTWEQISSGYRTRFELARILLFKPGLLILDEPLANLDIKAQQTILNDLRDLAVSRRSPMGIILSSQQLHEVEKVADGVIFIKNGNCLYQQQLSETSDHVIELETTASREALEKIFLASQVQIRFNGSYYSLHSAQFNSTEMLRKLVEAQIPVQYYRDITQSTKRFFNE